MRSPDDAFTRGLEAARPKLRRFAVSLCKNVEEAEDMVQDTMLRALTHRATFAEGTNLDAWLFTILKNTRLTRLRRKQREVEDPDEAFAKAVPFHDDPRRRIEALETLRLIDKLPAHFKTPLLLLADGASYEEIAFEMREHVGTIKSRVHRARVMCGLDLDDSKRSGASV